MYQFMNPYWVLVHSVEIIPSKQQKPFPNQSIKNSWTSIIFGRQIARTVQMSCLDRRFNSTRDESLPHFTFTFNVHYADFVRYFNSNDEPTTGYVE